MRRAGLRARGTILVGVVAALVMLQVLVVALTLGGARDQDLTVRRVESARAFYAAEAAMNLALREMCLGADEDGDGVVGGFWSGTPGSAPLIGVGGGRGWAGVSEDGGLTVVAAEGTCGESVHRLECFLP